MTPLSICIPTYNFGRFLPVTLDSILAQGYSDIEIVIVDGASTDDTPIVIDKYQKIFKYLTYHRLPAKGGIDKDIALSVKLATREYCWLFSADDCMATGALKRVIPLLNNGCDVYLCGVLLCDKEMTPEVTHHYFRYDSHDTDFELSDRSERLRYFSKAKTTTALFSFLSSIIIKKTKWDSADDSWFQFNSSYWGHVARLFSLIPNGLRVKVIHESLVNKRGENDSFYCGDIAKRIGVAVYGFSGVAKHYFGEQSEECELIHNLIRNEWPLIAFINYRSELVSKGLSIDLLDSTFGDCYSGKGLRIAITRMIYNHEYFHFTVRLFNLAQRLKWTIAKLKSNG
ncbi:hypothetical protein SIID45300_02687 [Candidatus Magnetaquicoccaceae bacterium FCR-1]|uniref:Glycosyltransferase 2-like domain-containing protein n=1 Tax=Candidatus Magnetaquiglobus chichijimensis TaxID=3141448 RepID=A0ABQ0CBT7_9PROT